ncbi:MAG TPA: PrsW family glutamic-type intramembrane protease [Verrucomicrobiae bacterium]|nr:PrsW family glutamic-type intramembrane protease [Verrucomicrobiae bacterium]
MTPETGTVNLLVVCVSGPDSGKRLAITSKPAVVGRAAACELASDDPDVAERHVTLHEEAGKPAFAAIAGCAVFLDGQSRQQGLLEPRQQLRVGRSLWQMESAPTAQFSTLIGDFGDRITDIAGVERIEGFRPAEMFSEALRKRTDEEMEQYFAVGTPSTTPPLAEVNTGWPKPWLFLKTFLLAATVYLGFLFIYRHFGNAIVLPGLLTFGAFVIPFSLLIFFFEINAVRNVPLYQLLKLMMLGGVLSVILSLFLFEWTRLDSWLGAMSAGLVEEAGKAAALLLVINKPKYRWTLNGMLFGAAVGTGFAAFESAGYAYLIGGEYGRSAMLSNITTRGILSIFGGHVLWTALVGAALWRVRGTRAFEWSMLTEPKFLRAYAVAAGLHMIWNSPLQLPLYIKYVILGFVIWIALVAFIQSGLRQIRTAQAEAASGDTTKTQIPQAALP